MKRVLADCRADPCRIHKLVSEPGRLKEGKRDARGV